MGERVCTAGQMATLLQQMITKLLELRIVDADSFSAVGRLKARLLAQSSSRVWDYSIARSNPITFKALETKRAGRVTPVVTVRVAVNEKTERGDLSPFVALNSTLEIYGESGDVLARWHVDVANEGQEGPIFHLQMGGHSSGNEMREKEFKLELPRWAHPPLDLVLLCELVLANFYPKEWEKLRRDPVWVNIVRDAEELCLEPYLQVLHRHASDTRKENTLLQRMWSVK